jgi:hypothetical protein
LVLGQARARVTAEIQRGEIATPPGWQAEPTAAAAVGTATAEPASHVPAYVAGGLALAALGTGIVFGVLANSALSQAQTSAYAAATQQQLATSGTDAVVADVLFGVSGAAAITAVILFLTERSSDTVRAGVAAVPGGAAAFIGGAF